MASSVPRSLADELRSWDDEALADLLIRRPDLAAPPPPDLSTLATTAAGRLSVARAVDGLDTAALQVLEVVAVLPEPVTAAEVSRRWGLPAASQLDLLRGLALLWGGPRSLRLVRAAREVLGAHPAGLGPPLAEALGRRSPQRLADLLDDLGLPATGDPDQALARLAAHLGDATVVHELVASGPVAARDLLDRLSWGPPIGQVEDADRPVRAGSAGSAVEWLLARGLLAVADAGHVVLPREVALALRGGRVQRSPSPSPPEPATRSWPAAQVAASAAQAAVEAVRLADELCRSWSASPPGRLRTGGLAVRDLRRLATTLELDDASAALIAEVCLAAGLIADDGELDPHFLPSARYDIWAELPLGARWAALASAWLTSSRAPSLAGVRRAGSSGRDAPLAALGPDLDRPLAPQLRREVLAVLARLPRSGSDLSGLADTGGADLLSHLDWFAPRRTARSRAELVPASLREAAWLGVTGLGALSPAGRLVLDGSIGEAATAVEAALPEPVSEVLLQADLTAVAPGRLEADAERELSLLADVESRGAATVYRFTATSARRALDAGRTADELLSFLSSVSSTPVPQPLSYLITDTARRHGRLRVGAASAYLRGDDEAAVAELLADRRAAGLGLRRLSATVLAAAAPPDVVLATLRSLGLAPAAESASGQLLIRRPETRRAPLTPAPDPHRARQPRREDLLLAVRSMRAVEMHARRPPPAAPFDDAPDLLPMEPQRSIAMIQDAVAARRDVWIGYLSDGGHASRYIVEPLAVEAGRIRALDRQTGLVRNYAVHRLIGVAPA